MTVGKIISIRLAVLVLCFAGQAKANTREFNLFDLGCPTQFSYNSSRWQTNLDIDNTFSSISHVYIDWSGQFTALLVLYDPDPMHPSPLPPPDDPSVPFPVDVSLNAHFYRYPADYAARISGGEPAYPGSESFAVVSELPNRGGWVPNGIQPYIEFRYVEPMGSIVKHGSLTLDYATLIIEGTVIPEPATLFLLGLGGFALLRKRR